MNYFKEQIVNFGSVKRNTSKEIIFTAERNIPKVVDITVGCGCTKVKWYEDSRILKVTYKAGEIPNQVIGNQDITKTVTLYYKDGNEETLTIKGIKTR